jgi:pimeloyl-ACP methyl ester carboxylesterase
LDTSATPTLIYRDGYVSVRGIRLHYVDYGGEGEVVVALHGLIQNAHAFDAIAPALVPHVRLLALDFRGRGLSDWGRPACYRFPEYLLDLRDFLRALGLDRLALIGTSLGGFVARLYSMAYPQTISRLVLNECAAGENLAGLVRAARRPSMAPPYFTTLGEAKEWFLKERDGLHRLTDDKLTAWVSHYLVSGANGRLRLRCDPAVVQVARHRAHHLQRNSRWWQGQKETAWQHVKRLTMPVLLLRGAVSDMVLAEDADRFVRELPDARCVTIPEMGHSPTLYEPEAQAAICNFFSVLAPPGQAMPSGS